MIHKLKFAGLIILSSLIALNHDRIFIIISFFISVFLSFCIKRNKVFSRIKPLLVVSVFILAVNLISADNLTISSRFFNGILGALKLISLSLMVFVYTMSTSPGEIVSVFSFLPPKAKVMLTITFSLIPITLAEAEKIQLVQKSRGYNPNSLNMISNILPLIMPLLNRTLKRAEQIGIILETKGYA